MPKSLRILGIETSSRRGSVALVENGSVVRAAAHDVPNLHAERLLPLVQQLLDKAGWQRADLSRVAVGAGPGSFTGLRVGMALAHGIALGLGIPALGIPSLMAMSRAVPKSRKGLRCALLDARRGEVFAGAYDETGTEKLAACVLPQHSAVAELGRRLGPGPKVFVGEIAGQLVPEDELFVAPEAELPHASWVALLALELEPSKAPLVPIYVRGPNAVLPNLPPSPLQPATGLSPDRGSTEETE